MQIKQMSVLVSDQERALKFYTEILGFKERMNVSMGKARWITVVSAEGPDDVELLLEPIDFPPAVVFQKALFGANIPLTAFFVPDVQKEYDRLSSLGVVFRYTPSKVGTATIALFEDTCGNLIQIVQSQ